jgi:DNA-binding response OmpR family regulator
MMPRQVMVVDDDSDVLSTMSKHLRMWGYDAVPFATFEDAREFLEDRAPDAMVVDVRLGKYNGLQLLHLARQHYPEVALVAVSGFDDPVLRAEAADAGAAYFLKPFELTDLREHLRATGVM